MLLQLLSMQQFFLLFLIKNFWIIPHEITGSRVIDLVNSLELSNRIVNTLDMFLKVNYNEDINYERVERILDIKRQQSLQWLENEVKAKDDREGTLIKNTAIITIGKICTQLITFFLLPLYTSLLSTQEYGIIDLLNTLVSLLVPIVTLQIEQGIFRDLIEVVEIRKKKQKLFRQD